MSDPLVHNGDSVGTRPGLRAQIALALLAALALAGTLALLAIRPLGVAAARSSRRRTGVTLARAVAGQVSLRPFDEQLQELLRDAVGPGAFDGVAVLDTTGRTVARAGHFSRGFPRPPYEDEVLVAGAEVRVLVSLPGRGAFVAEISLAASPAERNLYLGLVLYTAAASLAALFVVYVLLTRYTVRPIETLTRAAERVAAGRRDAMAEPTGAREVARAAVAFNAMTRQLAARERELSSRVTELERATRELRAAQDGLVRSERLAVVGRLAAGLAHEIGNPLAAIVGLTDLLRDGGLDESETRDFAERIGSEAQRIHKTVRELLDYARAAPSNSSSAPGEGAVRDEGPSHGEVSDAAAQVGRLLEPQKSMRGVRFTREIEGGLPAVALATERLVQVLLNLALNAADAARDAHGEHGAEVRLCARLAPVGYGHGGEDGERRSDGGARVVLVDVIDNGRGVPDELRARVFEPFYTSKPAGQGTGLGLAICSSLVEQAGGSIVALARDDGEPGALFRVELPAVKRASDD